MNKKYDIAEIGEMVIKWMNNKPLETKELLYHKHSKRIGLSDKKFLEILDELVDKGILKEISFFKEEPVNKQSDIADVSYYFPAKGTIMIIGEDHKFVCN